MSYTPNFTTYDDVVRLLGSSKLQIKIGTDEDDHISRTNAELCIRDAERELQAKLAKVYEMPITPYGTDVPSWVKETLATIALYLSAVSIFDAVPGIAVMTEGRPDTVKEWQAKAKDLLAPILERSYGLSGLVMRNSGRFLPVTDRPGVTLYDSVRGPAGTATDVETPSGAGYEEDDVLEGTP